jgi:hypothetical protein
MEMIRHEAIDWNEAPMLLGAQSQQIDEFMDYFGVPEQRFIVGNAKGERNGDLPTIIFA